MLGLRHLTHYKCVFSCLFLSNKCEFLGAGTLPCCIWFPRISTVPSRMLGASDVGGLHWTTYCMYWRILADVSLSVLSCVAHMVNLEIRIQEGCSPWVTAKGGWRRQIVDLLQSSLPFSFDQSCPHTSSEQEERKLWMQLCSRKLPPGQVTACSVESACWRLCLDMLL